MLSPREDIGDKIVKIWWLIALQNELIDAHNHNIIITEQKHHLRLARN